MISLGTILVIIVGIVSVILIFFITVEKRLQKKVSKAKDSLNGAYIEKISKLNPSNPKKTLEDIDKIARNFFREAFKTKATAEYSGLKDLFVKKKNKKVVEFCSEMDSLLYSGKTPDKKQNQKLLDILLEIIEKNKILSKLERMQLDKQSQAKDTSKEGKMQKILKKVGLGKKKNDKMKKKIEKN